MFSLFLQLCDLLKSRVESPNFLEKLGSIHMSVPNNMNGMVLVDKNFPVVDIQ